MILGHICSNDRKQDCWGVSSILHTVVSPVIKQITTLRSLSVETDNARNYQKVFVPDISPFIGTAQGLNLKGFSYHETERGKSLADAHFSIDMRHV